MIEKYNYNKPLKYKEICIVMGEQPISTINGSKERNNQIKRWQTDYEIHKEGMYYFIIRELSEDEKYILKNQKESTQVIKNVLIWYFYNKNEYKIYLTYNKIFEILHFVNSEYNKARHQTFKETMQKEFESEEEYIVYQKYINKFFYISKDIMADILDYVFKLLKSENVIADWKKHFAFYDYETYIDATTNKSKSYWKTIICTDSEVSKILSIQSDILESHNLSNTKQFYYCSPQEKNDIRNEMSQAIRQEFGHDEYSKIIEFQISKQVVLKKCSNIPLDLKIINKEIAYKLKKSKRTKDILFLDEFMEKYQTI